MGARNQIEAGLGLFEIKGGHDTQIRVVGTSPKDDGGSFPVRKRAAQRGCCGPLGSACSVEIRRTSTPRVMALSATLKAGQGLKVGSEMKGR